MPKADSANQYALFLVIWAGGPIFRFQWQ